MRNFAKIFTAIVVAFAAYSCVADATEDLGVQVGNGEGKTTITLSLEESRTQLGEKTGDVYPLYWSAGDQIAVNGTASTALGEEWNGKSSASFTVEGVTLPYSIVYPAPAEAALEEWGKETVEVTDPETGEPVLDAEGNPTTEEVDVLNAVLYPVTFPASQEYVANGIDGASAPMYGYSTKEGEVPTLKHLVGLLQFNVKGEGKVLKNIVVKSERGAIAGTYYVNCEKNLLVVKEGSTSNQVSMSFGDGLALGAEATTFYVAVPAGSYGTFVATLATDTEKMTVKFNSDVKPIAAGKVREFTAFSFVHNYNDSEEFIIDSEDKLIEFARIASTFYPHTIAKVTKSLDMSGKDWTPIEGFGNYTFDGGSDQGYTITGLKAPLFGTTGAKIKNVTLEGVNLTSNGKLIMGAIANTLTSGGQTEKASLTNCKAVGTLTISNPDWQPTKSQGGEFDIVNYGGLVGAVYGADLVDCTNQVAITVHQLNKADNTITLWPCIGGVIGEASKTTLVNGEDAVTTLSNCDNDAAISYSCIANQSDKALVVRPFIGGVLGASASAYTELEDCDNSTNGTISVNTSIGGVGSMPSNTAPMGGVVGYLTYADVYNCTNYGKVEADGRLYAIIMGGVGGVIGYSKSEKLNNQGAIEIKSTATVRNGVLVGGVAGNFGGSGGADHYFKDCHNNGPIGVHASSEEMDAILGEVPCYYRIGGVSGFGRVATSNCSNMEGGDITTSGNFVFASTSGEVCFSVAGCLAYKTYGAPQGEYSNAGDITVNTNFSYHEAFTADQVASVIGTQRLTISGVYGPQPGHPAKGTNTGNITFGGSCTTEGVEVHIGGVYAGGGGGNAYNKYLPSVTSNTGDITVGKDVVINGDLYVGGIVASTVAEGTKTSANNEGDITINCDVPGSLYLGGLFGNMNTAIFPGATNEGVITLGQDAEVTTAAYIGGVYGKTATTGTVSGLTNKGEVIINGSVPGVLYLGGIIGTGSVIATGANSTSTAAVTVGKTATLTGDAYVGGLIGKYDATSEVTELSNGGSVSVNCAVPGTLYLGGVLGQSAAVATSATNSGAVTVGDDAESAEALTVGGILNVGGVYGTYAGTAATSGMQNSGTVTVHKNVAVSGTNNLYIAGIFGGQYAGGNLSSITNSGDINVHCNTNATQHLFVSGVAKFNTKSKTATDITNTGNITVTGTSEANGDSPVRVAGVFTGLPSSGSTGTLTRVVNGAVGTDGKPVADKGKITVSGTIKGRLHQAGLCSFSAYNYRPGAMVDCHNYGEIAMTGSVGGYAYICGLSMSAPSGNTSTNTTNEGAINVSGTISGTTHISGMCYNSDQTNTVFTNCHNNGAITITESATIKTTAYIMGFGYRLTNVTYNNCSNTGNITYNGKHTGGDIYMAGFSADRFRPTAITGGLTNSGNISFGGTHSSSGVVYLSGIGVTAYTHKSVNYYPTFTNTGAIKNTGKISFTGSITHASAKLRVGGLFPSLMSGCTSIVAEGTTEFVNEGNLEVTGTVTTPANAMIGGIVGNALSPITGARCYCNIKAEGFSRGWITGAARSETVKAIDCAIGGGERRMQDVENEEWYTEPIFTIEDYFNYIYGGTTDWTGTTNYDGCGFLESKTAKPTTPEVAE